MVKAVKTLISGPKQNTPAAQAMAKAQAEQKDAVQKQEVAVAAEKKQLQVQQNSALNGNRKRRAGYRSLLTGLDTGVDNSASGTRTQLG